MAQLFTSFEVSCTSLSLFDFAAWTRGFFPGFLHPPPFFCWSFSLLISLERKPNNTWAKLTNIDAAKPASAQCPNAVPTMWMRRKNQRPWRFNRASILRVQPNWRLRYRSHKGIWRAKNHIFILIKSLWNLPQNGVRKNVWNGKGNECCGLGEDPSRSRPSNFTRLNRGGIQLSRIEIEFFFPAERFLFRLAYRISSLGRTF